jgi:hypothetical protein
MSIHLTVNQKTPESLKEISEICYAKSKELFSCRRILPQKPISGIILKSLFRDSILFGTILAFVLKSDSPVPFIPENNTMKLIPFRL